MFLKKAKNKPWAFLFVLLLGVVAAPLLYPQTAHAYNFYLPQHVSYEADTGRIEAVCPGNGLTRRVMPCIKETIIYATNEMLLDFSLYFLQAIQVACALAIFGLGLLMVGGKTTAPFRDSMVLIVKMSLVMIFSINFNGLFGALLDMMDEMLFIVTAYVMVDGPFKLAMLNGCEDWGDWTNNPTLLIWDAVDCTINNLVGGIFSEQNLTMGLIGFMVSALLSNTIGMIIGLIGIRIIISMMWAVIKALYVYIGAYIAIALMILFSPMFIPTVLFQSTKVYFDRWLKTLLNFMLQPLFMFAYLTMLLAAFDVIIFSGPYSLYRVIAGNAVDNPAFFMGLDEGGAGGVGGFLWNNGAYVKQDSMPSAVTIDSKGGDKRKNELSGSKFQLTPMVTDTGVGGAMKGRTVGTYPVKAEMVLEKDKQLELLGELGLGKDSGQGKLLNYFQTDVPVKVVHWHQMADDAGFNSKDPNQFMAYMMRVLITFIMAYITSLVFTSLIDSLPFISRGITNGGGLTEENVMGSKGLSGLKPPGDDAVAGIQSKLLGRFDTAKK